MCSTFCFGLNQTIWCVCVFVLYCDALHDLKEIWKKLSFTWFWFVHEKYEKIWEISSLGIFSSHNIWNYLRNVQKDWEIRNLKNFLPRNFWKKLQKELQLFSLIIQFINILSTSNKLTSLHSHPQVMRIRSGERKWRFPFVCVHMVYLFS